MSTPDALLQKARSEMSGFKGSLTGPEDAGYEEAGQDRVRASYGENYGRLAQIKATHDADDLFRVNQNIQPNA